MLITGQRVDITAGAQPYSENYRRVDKQSGLTVAADVPVVNAAINLVKAAEFIGESKNRRTQAMATANTAWRAYEGIGQVMGNPVGQGAQAKQNVRVSITVGAQKSETEQRQQGHTAAPSQVLAGKTATVIAQGAGTDANLIVTGSDIVGTTGTHLVAENHMTLQSAVQQDTSRSKNSSSGWNAGVAIEYGQGGASFGITAGANKGKGHANSDTTTHRHTHIGDATSLTSLSAGDTTTLKGAQLIGEQVQLSTPNLTTQSVQDTSTYEGKQQHMSGQITVGYGVSGEASFSRSNLKANYASVTEQSGIYAGDKGYHITVKEHTDLTGGLMTSTARAEEEGQNQFRTGTITARDIQNHADYEGSSLGIGAEAHLGGGWNGRTVTKEGKPTDTVSSGIGYGSVSDQQNSTTSSGINTQNLTITDADKQELLTGINAQVMAEQVFTATTTDNAKALSGALENRFNAQALQKELDVQREVSQEFSRNVQSAKGELNKAADRLKEQYERGELSIADYKATREQLENTSLLLSTVAAGLSAPTNSGLGIAAASLSPVAAKQIGQYFKAQGEQGGAGEGSAQHLIAHGLLAGAVAVAGGNNALSAATSAMSAEAAAPLLAQYLYGKDANTLSADEKTTITAITGLIGSGVGASTGSNVNIAQGTQAAQNAMEHNYLSVTQAIKFDQELSDCRKSGGDCQWIIEKWKKASDEQSAIVDERLKSNSVAVLAWDKEVALGGIEITERPAWLGVLSADVMRSEEAKAYVQQWNGQDLAKIDTNSPQWMKFAVFATDLENQMAVASLGLLAKDLSAAAISFMSRNRASATVKASDVGMQWGQGIKKQGIPWEDFVGKSLPADARLPKNFKTFDYYDASTKTAISAKSMDTQTMAKLSNPNQVYSSIKSNIDAAAQFKTARLSRQELTSSMIANREVHLAVPINTSKVQWTEINRAIEYGKTQGVIVKVIQVK